MTIPSMPVMAQSYSLPAKTLPPACARQLLFLSNEGVADLLIYKAPGHRAPVLATHKEGL